MFSTLLQSRRKAAPWRSAALASVLLLALPALQADDWPQWRGPQRTGISQEKGWQVEWPKEGPRQLWKADVGTGWSSMSVSQGRL